MTRVLYVLAAAWHGFSRNPFMSVASTLTVALMLVLLWAIWVLPFRPLAAVLPEAVWQRDVPFLAWTAVTVMMVYFRYGEGARDTARRWGRTLLADTHPRSPEDR